MKTVSPTLIVMRGIPGSGKSTFLAKWFHSVKVYSADSYRMVEGKYVYKPEDNAKIHNQCLRDFLGGAMTGRDLAVDNTNIKLFEITPYVRIGQCLGYRVIIFFLVCNARRAANQNIHEVPFDAVEIYANAIDPLPSFWEQHIITPDMLNDEKWSPWCII